MTTPILIAVFGLIGVFSRYFLDIFVARQTSGTLFPFGIFSINILGSFAAGFIYVMGTERMLISPELRLGLLVGFTGGFTTFSTYCLQSLLMFEQGHYFFASLYYLASPLCGLFGAALGVAIGRLSFPA